MAQGGRMPRPALGLLLGGALGLVDGASGFFYPELRGVMLGVVVYSTLKGLACGLLVGFFARRVQSLAAGIAAGLATGVALSYVVTLTAEPGLFWDIMLPGALLGLIVGIATQRFGRGPEMHNFVSGKESV